MRIKTRNRLILFGFIVSILILITYISFTIYQFVTGSSIQPEVQQVIDRRHNSFLSRYSPYAVHLSIIFEVFYACVTFRVFLNAFEKTQTSDILYFSLFSASLLLESTRLLIPLFNIAGLLSKTLFTIGKAIVFARILGPLALLFTNLFNLAEDQHQNIDRNYLIILMVSLFFSSLLPLNTTMIHTDYSISFACSSIIKKVLPFIIIINAISLAIHNYTMEYSQKTTIGFTLIAAGYFHLIYGISIVTFFISVAFMSTGTVLYLKQLHNQYLLDD